VSVFSGVRPDSPAEVLAAAVGAASDCDGLIALGGGSSIVTTRALSMPPKVGEQQDVPLTLLGLPYLAIPTTPTTAMARLGAAISLRGGGRLELFHPAAHPAALLLDEGLLAATPEQVYLDTAVATFSNAAEMLTTPHLPAPAHADLREAVDLAAWALVGWSSEDGSSASRRTALAVAAFLCGRAADCGLERQATLGMAVGHAVQRAMSEVSHGTAMAASLLVGLRVNADSTAQGQRALLDLLRVHADTADLQGALEAIVGPLGVPVTPSEIGIESEQLRALAPGLLESHFIRSNVRRFETADELGAALASAT